MHGYHAAKDLYSGTSTQGNLPLNVKEGNGTQNPRRSTSLVHRIQNTSYLENAVHLALFVRGVAPVACVLVPRFSRARLELGGFEVIEVGGRGTGARRHRRGRRRSV